MLSFFPFLSSDLQWENTSLLSDPNNFHNGNNDCSSNMMKLDHIPPIFSPSFQALEGDTPEFEATKFPQGEGQDLQFVDHAGQIGLGLEDSPPSQRKNASSAHKNGHGYSQLAKKLDHNARERDRRKRMNISYSALRALLPAPFHQKQEFSIPETVSLVLDYVPQLQKEVENLIRKKEELVSKFSALQGVGRKPSPQEEKEARKKIASVCAISVEKLGDREIIIHISAYVRVSMPEVLLLLENHGFMVIDVSCLQCFGGRTFCNVHLWTEEGRDDIVKCETLNQELLAMFEKGAHATRSHPLLAKNKEAISDLITFDPYPIQWIRQSEWILSKEEPPRGQLSCFRLLH